MNARAEGSSQSGISIVDESQMLFKTGREVYQGRVQPINPKRLEIDPTTLYCMECAQRL